MSTRLKMIRMYDKAGIWSIKKGFFGKSSDRGRIVQRAALDETAGRKRAGSERKNHFSTSALVRSCSLYCFSSFNDDFSLQMNGLSNYSKPTHKLSGRNCAKSVKKNFTQTFYIQSVNNLLNAMAIS